MKSEKEFFRGLFDRLSSNSGFATATLAVIVALAFMLGAGLQASGPRYPVPVAVANLRSTSKSVPTAVFAPDKGKLRILVNGQQVGSEEYEIGSSNGGWMARGTADIQSPEGAIHVTGTLALRADGTPVRYEWSTQGAKKASAVVAFEGTTVTSELHMGNARPFTQTFTFSSPRVAVLDNNLYHQYAVLARLYDWDKKGAQTFSVLVPQELTPGTATVEWAGKQDSDGKSVEKLRVKTEDNEIDVFVDGPRLARISVPSANAEIVRE
jgi:hypothetical protein